MSTTVDDSAPLLVEADGAVRIVTMNRPQDRNAMKSELRARVHDVWRELADDRDARSVVLTGAGPVFSAGGDMKQLEENTKNPDARRRSLRQAGWLVDDILACPLPVIAAVNGPAVGLGCTIATLCDIVIMAESSYFADTHVNIGLVAGDGGAMVWPLMMSIIRAKEYLFTGERISAQKAVELGLANRAVPDGDLMSASLELAHKLAGQPAQALQQTKLAINRHLQVAASNVLPFALAAESESFAQQDIVKSIETFRSRGR